GAVDPTNVAAGTSARACGTRTAVAARAESAVAAVRPGIGTGAAPAGSDAVTGIERIVVAWDGVGRATGDINSRERQHDRLDRGACRHDPRDHVPFTRLARAVFVSSM